MNTNATTQLSFDADTDVGRSRRGGPNQDSIGTFADYTTDEARLAAKGKLFVVADGMGGAAGGKEASSIAIAAVLRSYYDDPDTAIEASLERAFQVGNTAVQQHGRDHPELRGMGTTIAAAVVRGQTLVAGNVGDSRAYILRGGDLRQISLDHTMVQEQVREGVLLPEEAEIHPRRHVLSRNLGYRPRAQPDFVSWTILNDDVILLCSDGLWGPVGDGDLAGVLRKERGKQAVQMLIELANERGGPDNISAIVIRVESVAAGAGSATTEPVAEKPDSVTTEPDAKRPGSAVTEPIEPRATSVRSGKAAGLSVATEPMVTAAPVAAPVAAPAAPPPAAAPAPPPGRGAGRRLLPMALIAAVVLLGSTLLYRTYGGGEAVVAGSDTQSGAAAAAVPSLAAAASRITQALAPDEPSATAQAEPSPAPTSSPRATQSPTASQAVFVEASASPAEAVAALSTFEVLKTPNSLALSPDGLTLALGSSDGEILLLRASDGAQIGSTQAHAMAVNSLAFSPDGRYLASAADDGTISLWLAGSAPASGQLDPAVAPAPEVIRAAGEALADQLYAIGLDGEQLVFAEKQDQQVNLWRQDAGQPFSTLDGLGSDVQSIVFAPDGQSLAVVTGSGPLQLWRVASAAEAGTVSDRPAGMWSVAFEPGQQSVVLGFPDSHVERRSYSFDDDPPRATARAAASAGAAASPGQPVDVSRLLDLAKHDSAVVTVVFRDGQTLLSASRDGEIRQWSLAGAVQSLPAEAAPPASVAPSGRPEPGE